jgi:hypothetical protein
MIAAVAGLAVVLPVAGTPTAAIGAEPARAATTLTLRASEARVTFGDRLRLVATLEGPPGGQAILLERVATGGPTVIGGCVTGNAGRCAVVVKPRRATTYRAVFAGAGSWDPSTSDPVSVAVRMAVEGTLRGFTGRAGRYRLYPGRDRVTFVAHVEPERRGTRVWFPLEFNYGRGWRDGGTSSFRTTADGQVTIYFARGALPVGAYRIRAETRPTGGLLAGRSPLAYFRVKA